LGRLRSGAPGPSTSGARNGSSPAPGGQPPARTAAETRAVVGEKQVRCWRCSAPCPRAGCRTGPRQAGCGSTVTPRPCRWPTPGSTEGLLHQAAGHSPMEAGRARLPCRAHAGSGPQGEGIAPWGAISRAHSAPLSPLVRHSARRRTMTSGACRHPSLGARFGTVQRILTPQYSLGDSRRRRWAGHPHNAQRKMGGRRSPGPWRRRRAGEGTGLAAPSLRICGTAGLVRGCSGGRTPRTPDSRTRSPPQIVDRTRGE